ncbi:HAD-IC family P-type ATPase [Candidatus Saccharibacteria bacterium]|nr:HAD-IC family P-type ATPase [Candidatus Saccharibacteria bacterium]
MTLTGLTTSQVQTKIKQGKVNRAPAKNSNSISRIILRNTLTIFNLVNLILALMIISVGAYKNLLFILVAIANTGISIINGIRAKRTIDKMRLLAEQQPTVIRDSQPRQIPQDQIVDGDLLVYALGDQIVVDSQIKEGTVEVNESFITGEQDNIAKHPGDQLVSGSFIVSGTCKAEATSVGADNFINKLESSAHTIKTADSKLFKLINNIVKYISFALIPIGALLLWARFNVPDTTAEVAVTSTVAGLISMIPEGLVLLTSSVLALATIRLSRQKVLVQDLYSVETLARVDTICLDKTGTLTTGQMSLKGFILPDDSALNATKATTPTILAPDFKSPIPAQKSLQNALKAILSAQESDNATSTALKAKLLKGAKFEPREPILEVIPFSSDRKYSGVITNKATYLMGAPEYLLTKTPDLPGDYRVIAVVKSQKEGVADNVFLGDISRFSSPETYIPDATEKAARRADFPGSPVYDVEGEKVHPRKDMSVRTPSFELLGYVLLEDELRGDAKEIINYFYANDVDVKIISGDNLRTVQTIATKTGVRDPSGIDLSTLRGEINYEQLVKKHNIFTRVKPAQKKSLVLALKKQGRTVAMTGDGVNDILAMKEADCSIAIGEGSDAARRSAKLVLLKSDFSAVPRIIDEGRQSINNLERSATLFLSKNTYAAILAILFILIPLEYPYAPLEMSLLNFACIGLPGVILALESNTERVKNKFIKNILGYSVPTGITVAITMLIFSVIAENIGFTRPELITTSAIVTFAIDFLLIYSIARPLNLLRTILLAVIIGIITLAIMIPFTRNFLDFTLLTPDKLLLAAILIIVAYTIFAAARFIMRRLTPKILARHPRLQI